MEEGVDVELESLVVGVGEAVLVEVRADDGDLETAHHCQLVGLFDESFPSFVEGVLLRLKHKKLIRNLFYRSLCYLESRR